MFNDFTRRGVPAAILETLLPPLCLGCASFTREKSKICGDCRSRIEQFEFPICLQCKANLTTGQPCGRCQDQWTPLFIYGIYRPPLREIVLQFKFHGITSPARFFAAAIVEKYRKRIEALEANLLVPVPLHPARENRRGYNQAALLAAALGRELNLENSKTLVIRDRRGRPQSKLRVSDRRGNVSGVFSCPVPPNQLSRVILVDDVVTSGATLMELEKTLTGAGVNVVGAVAIAHGM